MKVERLTLRSFRNIRECEFRPDPQINFLVGQNGQGKTSFLEALGFLSTLRSFRGSRSPEVVRWGDRLSEIACTLTSGVELDTEWRTDLKVSFEILDDERRKARKLAFINGKPYRSSTQYLSQRFGSYELGFHSIVFNPSDHDLVRGEPSIRRAYLDRVLASEDLEYLQAYQRYQRVLEQRNALLKSSPSPSRDVLAGFSEPMSRFAAVLAYKRLKWVQNLAAMLDETVHQIAPRQPILQLFYLSNWVPQIDGLSIANNNLTSVHFAGHGPLPSIEQLEQAFWTKLSSLEMAEWRSGHSLVGPHRDDWSFYLGGQMLKGHGSQGEVRSALLALKLSEIEQFRNATGHRPLFLLDDFSSELDRERREFLLRFLSKTDLQVYVTTTEASSFIGRRFWVSEGDLTESGEGVMPGLARDPGISPESSKNEHERRDQHQQRNQGQ